MNIGNRNIFAVLQGNLNPYQTADNALVRMWDGGYQTEEPNVWTDMIVGQTQQLNGNSFTGNAVQINGVSRKFLTFTQMPSFNGDFTLELCWSWQQSTPNQWGRPICWRSNMDCPVEFYVNKGTDGSGTLCGFAYGENGSEFFGEEQFDYTAINTYVMQRKSGMHVASVNGLSIQSEQIEVGELVFPSQMKIATNEDGTCSVNGLFYSLRLYNRCLTNDEVVNNFMTDRKRFRKVSI